MAFELFKTLTGNEVAVAFVVALATTLFFVLTGSKAKVVVNPGAVGGGRRSRVMLSKCVG
jgi:hypothetical protein